MTTVCAFTIPGEPRGKGRPRATIRGKHAGVYTDSKTAAYENLVAIACHDAMAGAPPAPGAVSVEVEATLTIPSKPSRPKLAAMLSGHLLPLKTPDLDNIVKAVTDGCNRIAYADDKQIVVITARKRFAQTPGVVVIVRTVESVA